MKEGVFFFKEKKKEEVVERQEVRGELVYAPAYA